MSAEGACCRRVPAENRCWPPDKQDKIPARDNDLWSGNRTGRDMKAELDSAEWALLVPWADTPQMLNDGEFYAFKYKRFRNTRNRVTFGIPL
jgi:hypothetical protein